MTSLKALVVCGAVAVLLQGFETAAVNLDRVLDEAVDGESLGPWLEESAVQDEQDGLQQDKSRLLRAIGASGLRRDLSADPEPSPEPSKAPTSARRLEEDFAGELSELLPKPFLPANTVCTFTSGTCVKNMPGMEDEGCILVITEGESRRQLREQGAAPEEDIVGLLREQGLEGDQLARAVEENRSQSRTGFVQARQKSISDKPLLLIDQLTYHAETVADQDEAMQIASANCRATGDLATALGIDERTEEGGEHFSCFFSLIPSEEQTADRPGHFFIHAHFGASYVSGECHVIDEE